MIDPPCKHWRERYKKLGGIDDFLGSLDMMWQMNLNSYARDYPYLASPTAKCGCNKCRSGK